MLAAALEVLLKLYSNFIVVDVAIFPLLDSTYHCHMYSSSSNSFVHSVLFCVLFSVKYKSVRTLVSSYCCINVDFDVL
ncbi:hypothetical protein HID58_016177 [Brassica napus]|uniref:Uncharacterized protein n=1 Tax=Brassica napus TaxID=3708 RepID=A0ABQ8DM54_BRANA|nr:hypothetical protein HID58_016177 [Brassica napus]